MLHRSTRRVRVRPRDDYSRAYLHHLIKSGEYLGAMILSWVNTVFYQDLMAAMREAISAGNFEEWAAADEGAHHKAACCSRAVARSAAPAMRSRCTR